MLLLNIFRGKYCVLTFVYWKRGLAFLITQLLPPTSPSLWLMLVLLLSVIVEALFKCLLTLADCSCFKLPGTICMEELSLWLKASLWGESGRYL